MYASHTTIVPEPHLMRSHHRTDTYPYSRQYCLLSTLILSTSQKATLSPTSLTNDTPQLTGSTGDSSPAVFPISRFVGSVWLTCQKQGGKRTVCCLKRLKQATAVPRDTDPPYLLYRSQSPKSAKMSCQVPRSFFQVHNPSPPVTPSIPTIPYRPPTKPTSHGHV
jgi:hypothetical protein